MKILCVSDHIDPLVYSNSAKERFRDISLVLSAGDLPMDYLAFISATLNRLVGFVFGNHNLKELHTFLGGGRSSLFDTSVEAQMRSYYGATCLEGTTRVMEGVIVAGLGGSIAYNNGEHQFSDFAMTMRIIRLIPRLLFNRLFRGRYLDILLTHAPPQGIHDKEDRCHQGFSSFLWFMRVFRPRYLLHGHIHLYDINEERVTHYHETQIINVYDHYVLDLDRAKERGTGDE